MTETNLFGGKSMDFSQNTSISGLKTVTFVAPANGNYVFDGKLSHPKSGNIQSSTPIVTINLNGSPIYTTLASAKGFRCVQPLLTTDTITIVVSSSTPSDAVANAIKTIIAISAGE